MNRILLIDNVVEIARVIWVALGLLFVVDRLDAHIAVLIALGIHLGLLLFFMPRPVKMQGQYNPEELATYKEGRRAIIRKFIVRVVIWLGLLFILIMLGNASGWTFLPFWFSIYVLIDTFRRAGKDASEIDDLFVDPIRKVTGAIPKRQRHV